MNQLPIRPNSSPKNKNPLWEDILKFSKNKIVLVVLLVVVGTLGLIVPVIPGIALFVLAMALLRKGWMTKFRRRFRLWKTK